MLLVSSGDGISPLTLSFFGTSEELLALAAAFTMKAKHPDNSFQTYTGIPGVHIKIEHLKDEEVPPRYTHDCPNCTYLGQYRKFDLYFCPQGGSVPTVIARDGDNGPDYGSGMGLNSPEYIEAERRARERGLL